MGGIVKVGMIGEHSSATMALKSAGELALLVQGG